MEPKLPPEYKFSPHADIDERSKKVIASTYPPDMGDPQVLFTSLEGVAQYLLSRIVGLDVNDAQERNTPRRFLEALKEMTTSQTFEFTTFESHVDEMVVETGIQFATLCRHHVLPFTGICHVAYVPNGRIAGLSKIPRLVGVASAKLNTQEELTSVIADTMLHELNPQGVGVVMEAQHTCMAIRGARSIGVTTRTAAMRGVFADHTKTAKAEFLGAIR